MTISFFEKSRYFIPISILKASSLSLSLSFLLEALLKYWLTQKAGKNRLAAMVYYY